MTITITLVLTSLPSLYEYEVKFPDVWQFIKGVHTRNLIQSSLPFSENLDKVFIIQFYENSPPHLTLIEL